MSHHDIASQANPTGAVEVVRVSNSAATTAPVDPGSAAASAGAAAPAATSAATSAPVSSVVGGQATTPAAGLSGTPGANLPVDDIQQASTTIQNAQADLSRTAGAERRLDMFDRVGGDGGGGGEAGQENANNAEGAVAQGTDGQNVSGEQGGLGELRDQVGEAAVMDTSLDQQGNVVGEINNSNDLQEVNASNDAGTTQPADATNQVASATGLPDMDPRSELPGSTGQSGTVSV